jgi:hypothetical protein
MTFYIGSVNVFPGVLPTISNTTRGAPLTSDGTTAYWAYPGEAHTIAGSGWRYRTILTHGFVAGGYKGSNPWRSVNKTWHATDITFYCGEQMDRAASYMDGLFSDYYAYVMGTSDSHAAASVYVSSYNLHTGTMRSQNDRAYENFGVGSSPTDYTGYDPKNENVTYGAAPSGGASTGGGTSPGTGGWTMNTARNNHGCASGVLYNHGYCFGGGTTVTERMHFPTETTYTTTAGPSNASMCAWGGQNNAWLGATSNAGQWYMSYSSDSFTSWSWSGAPNANSGSSYYKYLGSKYGTFYAGGDNNTFYKFNESTTSYLASVSKVTGHDEENLQMGQDWGYMLGMYNSQQNNWTAKYTYSTDTGLTLGFASQPKGHIGMSSGCCSSAAVSITQGIRL